MASVLELASRAVDFVAQLLVNANHNIPLSLPPGANDAAAVRTYWFTTPRFFVLEWLATHAVLVPAILWLARLPWTVDVSAAPPPPPPPVAGTPATGGAPPRRRCATTAFDAAVLAAEAMSVVTAVAIVAYKLPSGRAAYLAQPCHLQNFLLVALMPTGWRRAAGACSAAPADTTPARIFHFFLSTWYSALLALATPDLRGQTMFLEIENFFTQHALLLVLPTLWLLRRRFTLYAGVHPWVLCWLVFWLMHLDVFVPLSLLSGRNINYVLVPPPIGFFRAAVGVYYRPAVGFITGCLTVLAFAATKAIVYLGRLRAAHAADADAAGSCGSSGASGDEAGRRPRLDGAAAAAAAAAVSGRRGAPTGASVPKTHAGNGAHAAAGAGAVPRQGTSATASPQSVDAAAPAPALAPRSARLRRRAQ